MKVNQFEIQKETMNIFYTFIFEFGTESIHSVDTLYTLLNGQVNTVHRQILIIRAQKGRVIFMKLHYRILA